MPERDPTPVTLTVDRCACTYEAGDSECPIHPTDPETGEPTGSWMKVAELAARDADKERDQWRDAYVALRVAANKLRDRWSEGGCITTPACGSCTWCDFEAALSKDGPEPDARALAAESRADDYEEALRHEIAAWQKATGCKTPGESESRAERAEALLREIDEKNMLWQVAGPMAKRIEAHLAGVAPESGAPTTRALLREAQEHIFCEPPCHEDAPCAACRLVARIDAHLSPESTKEPSK